MLGTKKSLVIVFGLIFVSSLIIPACKITSQVMYSGEVFDVVRKGDAFKMKHLIDLGASPNKIWGTNFDETPLVRAALNSDIPMMKVLIKAGADVNALTGHKMTALMCAKTAHSAQILLDAGADAKLRSEENFTAWDYMKKDGFNEAAKVLEAKQ